jgi:F0F1-type ATP synthase assembly protein I
MVQSKDDRQSVVNTVLTVMVGQVGCITLVVILLALLGGLWLDRYFETRPLFTIVFLLGSIPATLFLMFRVARAAIDRIRPTKNENAGRPASQEDLDRD